MLAIAPKGTSHQSFVAPILPLYHSAARPPKQPSFSTTLHPTTYQKTTASPANPQSLSLGFLPLTLFGCCGGGALLHSQHPPPHNPTSKLSIMAWQPSPESLQTLAVYLKESLSGFDQNAQKKAELVSCPIYHKEFLVLWDYPIF